MPPPDLSSHQLSPSASQHIFTTQILPQDIDPVSPSPNSQQPTAILVVGQTGAGKTRLVPEILSALSAAGRRPVHLIADVYKTHHPAYASLPSHLASPATGTDARIWLGMATEEAARRRQDVLIESACRHHADFSSLATILHEASYHVTVMILAVPYPLSRLGILVRYYQNLPEAQSRGLPLRLTPAKVHDESYEGLLKAAEWLDESDVADRVLVVRRDNLVAFFKRSGVQPEQGIAEAVRGERRRPLSTNENQVVADGVEQLRLILDAEEQLKAFKGLLEAFGDNDGCEGGGFPKLRRLEFYVPRNESDRSDDTLQLKLVD